MTPLMSLVELMGTSWPVELDCRMLLSWTRLYSRPSTRAGSMVPGVVAGAEPAFLEFFVDLGSGAIFRPGILRC